MITPMPQQWAMADANGSYTGIALINSNTTIYVTTAGSDSAGTGATATPFATIQKAMSYLQNFYISASAAVTISVGSGTFVQTTSLNLWHACGSQINITGTTSAGSPQTITSANTTTLSWVGVNTNGLNLMNGKFGTVSNLYILGGSLGSNNANVGIYVNEGTIYSLSMVNCQYWTIGIEGVDSSLITGTSVASMNMTSYGIYSNINSNLTFSTLYVSTTYIGALTSASSFIQVNSSTLTTNTYGVFNQVGSTVYCVSVTFTSNSSYCIYSTDCSSAVSQSGTYTSNGNSNAPTPAFGSVGNNNSYNSNS